MTLTAHSRTVIDLIIRIVDVELSIFNSLPDSETKSVAVTAGQQLKSTLQSVQSPGLTNVIWAPFRDTYPRQMQVFEHKCEEIHQLSSSPEYLGEASFKVVREQKALGVSLVQELVIARAAGGTNIEAEYA